MLRSYYSTTNPLGIIHVDNTVYFGTKSRMRLKSAKQQSKDMQRFECTVFACTTRQSKRARVYRLCEYSFIVWLTLAELCIIEIRIHRYLIKTDSGAQWKYEVEWLLWWLVGTVYIMEKVMLFFEESVNCQELPIFGQEHLKNRDIEG